MSQGMSSIILMVVLIIMIYFMMIRPQRRKDKADREMRESLMVGDEIVTIGGIVGKVTKITDKTVFITTGADKTKIEFLKTAIGSVSKSEANKAEAKKEEKSEDAESKAKTPDRDKKVTPKKLSRKSDEQQAE
ncbi:MAG: preprotein translocase subunit YajC [Clostridiales bacterium]|nr:preprotein translocase subunit YajC [Clostridiales bacterium]